MTGIWQVLGSARITLHEMVNRDYLDGANRQLWLDQGPPEDRAVHARAVRAVGDS